MMPKHPVILSVVGLAYLIVPVQAQGNLVVNGGFENLFAGWEGTFGYLDKADFAYEGTGVGIVDDVGSSSVGKTMYQNLSTEPAVPYYLRFSLLSGAGRVGEQSPPGASPVIVRWAGQTIAQVANPSTTVWKSYEYRVTASSSLTELNFESNGTRWQFIDGISVTVIPEPSSKALVMFGLLIGCAYFWRNKG